MGTVLASIKERCADRLEPALIPDHVVRMPALPKDILGKINKKRLRRETQAQLASQGR